MSLAFCGQLAGYGPWQGIYWIYPPPRMPVANEGLGWDSLLKMFHNPGGDWNPGWGVDLRYIHLIIFSSGEIYMVESTN